MSLFGSEYLVYYALAAAAAGTATSAYATVQQGKAEERRARFDAKVQENNAISEGYAAAQESQAALREVDAIREQRIRNLSSQRTAAAASGLMISGSVLDVMGDSALASEKEIAQAYYGGQLNIYNRQQRSNELRSQAIMTRSAGSNARRNSLYQAGGTLLSGAADAGYRYASFKKK